MNKYIELKDIEKLITACEWRLTLAKERNGEGFVDYSKQVLDVDELTERLSELIALDIVYCVECRYKDMIICPMHNLTKAGVLQPYDFCSYGDRIKK